MESKVKMKKNMFIKTYLYATIYRGFLFMPKIE